MRAALTPTHLLFGVSGPAENLCISLLTHARVCRPSWQQPRNEDGMIAVITELHGVLVELSAIQKPFEMVDADLSWEVRTTRLLDWLRTAPAFKCVDLTISEGSFVSSYVLPMYCTLPIAG
jgi:hypothetical protein